MMVEAVYPPVTGGDDIVSTVLKYAEVHKRTGKGVAALIEDSDGFLYGAGDPKIGQIVGKGKAEGKKLKTRFLKSLPKLKKLLDNVKKVAKERGHVRGLDGRLILSRSAHSAPNALLQGAGAVVMKKALVILDESLNREGYVAGVDYEFVGNIHDEYQAEVKEHLVERYIELANDSIRLAGEYFNLSCPMAGETKVGDTWAETHLMFRDAVRTSSELWAIIDSRGDVLWSQGGSSTPRKLLVFDNEITANRSLTQVIRRYRSKAPKVSITKIYINTIKEDK